MPASDGEIMDDLTMSMPSSGYSSLPGTPQRTTGGSVMRRTVSVDSSSSSSSSSDEVTDGNAMSGNINTRSLTRGGR